MGDKIGGPSWLKKDLLEKALREGRDSDVAVDSFDITRRNEEGEGYCSDMYWVKVNLKNNGVRRLIVKCLPEGVIQQEMVANMNAFETEMRMLSKTLPAMYKLLEKAKPGKYQPFGAKCLYSSDKPVEFIIMEDLGHAGFTVLQRQNGISLPHCRMIMKTLGQFHAASLSLYDENPDEIRSYKEHRFSETGYQILDNYIQNGLKSLIVEVSKWPNSDELVERLQKQKDELCHRLKLLTTLKEDELNVLNHGDMWTNNMMFRNSGDRPLDMRFLDLQLSHYGSPVMDLHYFIFSSPADEVRSEYVDSLLEEYHASFLETLNDLGNSKYAITFFQLKNTFNKYLSYGFFSALGILPLVLRAPEDGYDLDSSISSNNAAGGTGGLHTNPNYVKVMKRLVPVFIEQGII